MVIEIATFRLAPGETGAFLDAMDRAAPLLRAASGYRGHKVGLGVEDPGLATLIVEWRSHADHVERFEPSAAHEESIGMPNGLYVGEIGVAHVDAGSPDRP